jgi:hypothetical protein
MQNFVYNSDQKVSMANFDLTSGHSGFPLSTVPLLCAPYDSKLQMIPWLVVFLVDHIGYLSRRVGRHYFYSTYKWLRRFVCFYGLTTLQHCLEKIWHKALEVKH